MWLGFENDTNRMQNLFIHICSFTPPHIWDFTTITPGPRAASSVRRSTLGRELARVHSAQIAGFTDVFMVWLGLKANPCSLMDIVFAPQFPPRCLHPSLSYLLHFAKTAVAIERLCNKRQLFGSSEFFVITRIRFYILVYKVFPRVSLHYRANIQHE